MNESNQAQQQQQQQQQQHDAQHQHQHQCINQITTWLRSVGPFIFFFEEKHVNEPTDVAEYNRMERNTSSSTVL